jgi:hypothetical protein
MFTAAVLLVYFTGWFVVIAVCELGREAMIAFVLWAKRL